MLAKMYKEAVAINKEEVLKVSPIKDYAHTKEVAGALLAYDEMIEACKFYPIYFIKDDEGVKPIAILGFEKNNSFLDNKDKWLPDHYIPAIFRAYPLGMAQVGEEENKFTLIYDKSYAGINTKDGQAVTDDNGELTDFGQNAVDFLRDLQNNLNKTAKVLRALEDYELLEFINVDVNKGEKKFQIQAVGRVNQKKLEELEDKKVLELVEKGVYQLIVAHWISASNINSLADKA